MSNVADNLDSWPTKGQAAQILGVSEKTIERMAARGEIQQATRKQPGRQPLAVYSPADVARLKDEQAKPLDTFVVPAQTRPTVVSELSQAAPLLPALVDALAGRRDEVRVTEKLFLSVPEAARYSGLPAAYIRRLVADGKLEGLKTGGGWRIRRVDLEKL